MFAIDGHEKTNQNITNNLTQHTALKFSQHMITVTFTLKTQHLILSIAKYRKQNTSSLAQLF